MRALRSLVLPFLVPLVVLLAACSDSDAVSVRVRLAPDLSGELFASALSMPREAAPLEGGFAGVEWRDRARIDSASGHFADLNGLAIEDLRFSAESHSDGLSYVRVVLPRGPNARWYKLFTTADDVRRRAMARALEPDGSADRVGASVKLVIETPAELASAGVHPNPRGVRADTKLREASLIVPLEAVSSGEGELEWNVTW